MINIQSISSSSMIVYRTFQIQRHLWNTAYLFSVTEFIWPSLQCICLYVPGQGISSKPRPSTPSHYGDDIIGAIASQITSLTIVYSTVYSDADQRKHQSSASLAFMWGPVNSPHKWPVTRKMFPFDDVIMKFDGQICFLWFYIWLKYPDISCVCHDSKAVVSCAMIYTNPFIRILVRAKLSFCRIWITTDKNY